MMEETFSDLFQNKKINQQHLRPGDRIQATVAAISGDNIFLDIGSKSEGIIKADEFPDNEEHIKPEIGDTITVFFLANRNGEMIFTTKVGSSKASIYELEEAYRSGIPVEGKVIKEIKGGFEVTIAGKRAFCPYSQIDIRHVEEPEEYLDRTIPFKIIEFSSKGKNIILSARTLLEEKKKEERAELEKNLQESMIVTGTVSSIRNFGAFVDLGGVDGLIPMSELTWGQVDNIEDILTKGQRVNVIIKKLDWDKDKITLSLRETTPNPWSSAEKKYYQGSLHRGQVSRLTHFGAFVTLEPGIDGLIHISKLGSGRKINHPREVLEIGQSISIKVEAIDSGKQRISLELEDYPKDLEESSKTIDDINMKTTSQALGTLGDLFKSKLNKKN